MMPIRSLDHLMNRTANGYSYRAEWQFTTNIALIANRYTDTSSFRGMYGTNLYTGTALNWNSTDSTATFALPLGPTPGFGETKHIFMGTAVSSVATGVPGYLILVDLQGYWPGISHNTTSPQTLSGTPTLRYANGEGCRLYLVTTTATGSGTPNVSLSYTNSAGTSGRGLPFTSVTVASNGIGFLPMGATTSMPFLALNGSDTGVQNVASVTMSAATAGVSALCLAKPLLTIPLAVAASINERDFATQIISLPEVKNSACLVWLHYTGAATLINSNFYGAIEYVWG